jgi:hypothetical protein
LDPLALVALLSAAAALLCATVPALCSLVMPLALASSLLGAAGLIRASILGRARLLLPATGTGLAIGLLFAALLSPSLLGPVFLASRAKVVVDRNSIRVLPLPGSIPNSGPMDPDWVDASRAGLQQGGISLRVVDTRLRRVSSKSPLAAPAGSRFDPPLGNGDYQLVRLREQRMLATNLTARSGQTGKAIFDKGRPRLMDQTGKVYKLRRIFDIDAAGPGDLRPAQTAARPADSRPAQGKPRPAQDLRSARPKSAELPAARAPLDDQGSIRKEPPVPHAVFPVVVRDLVLVFDAPDPAGELRLEIPAEAWNQHGAFRFTIPVSMIHDERPRLPGRRY